MSAGYRAGISGIVARVNTRTGLPLRSGGCSSTGGAAAPASRSARSSFDLEVLRGTPESAWHALDAVMQNWPVEGGGYGGPVSRGPDRGEDLLGPTCTGPLQVLTTQMGGQLRRPYEPSGAVSREPEVAQVR